MKTSELTKQLGPDEYIRVVHTAYVLKRTGDGNDSIRLITRIDDDVDVISAPPNGHFRVTNIYVDSTTGKTVVQFDNTPV